MVGYDSFDRVLATVRAANDAFRETGSRIDLYAKGRVPRDVVDAAFQTYAGARDALKRLQHDNEIQASIVNSGLVYDSLRILDEGERAQTYRLGGLQAAARNQARESMERDLRTAFSAAD